MKEKIYNHPLVQHAVETFGEASDKVSELVGFLNRPEVNLDQVESIRLPHGDFIAQHGQESSSSIPSGLKEGQGIDYAIKRKPVVPAGRAGNVAFRPREGFNTWDHGGFIISTVGLDMEGNPFQVHIPRGNRYREQADKVADEIEIIAGSGYAPRQPGENARGITFAGNQDAHLGHTMHMALVNASTGRMPIELAASLIDSRADLSSIAGSMGLAGIHDPNNFRYYHRPHTNLSSDWAGYRGELDGLFRRMKRGFVIGETGHLGEANQIPGDYPRQHSPNAADFIDPMPNRPVAILNGRQVVPHPSFMLQDRYLYNIATSNWPKEYSWRWAQYERAHDPELPYYLDQMGPYFRDSGVSPIRMPIHTNLTRAYVHKDVRNQLANTPYKMDDLEREIEQLTRGGYSPGIMGWSMDTDGNFPVDPDDARKWFDTNDYYIDD